MESPEIPSERSPRNLPSTCDVELVDGGSLPPGQYRVHVERVFVEDDGSLRLRVRQL